MRDPWAAFELVSTGNDWGAFEEVSAPPMRQHATVYDTGLYDSLGSSAVAPTVDPFMAPAQQLQSDIISSLRNARLPYQERAGFEPAVAEIPDPEMLAEAERRRGIEALYGTTNIAPPTRLPDAGEFVMGGPSPVDDENRRQAKSEIQLLKDRFKGDKSLASRVSRMESFIETPPKKRTVEQIEQWNQDFQSFTLGNPQLLPSLARIDAAVPKIDAAPDTYKESRDLRPEWIQQAERATPGQRETMQNMGPILGPVASGFAQTGAGLASLVSRPLSDDAADYFQARSQSYSNALNETGEDSVVPKIVQQGIQGATRSIVQMGISGAAGKAGTALTPIRTMIAGAALDTYNSSLSEATAAGVTGKDRQEYAAKQAVIEAATTAAFQKVGQMIPGFGGAEDALSKPLVAGLKAGMKDAAKRLPVAVLAENAEELSIAAASELIRAVDLNQMERLSPENLQEIGYQTAVTTTLTLGLAEGGRVTASALTSPEEAAKWAQQNPEKAQQLVDGGGSRSSFAEALGTDRNKLGVTAEQRKQVVANVKSALGAQRALDEQRQQEPRQQAQVDAEVTAKAEQFIAEHPRFAKGFLNKTSPVEAGEYEMYMREAEPFDGFRQLWQDKVTSLLREDPTRVKIPPSPDYVPPPPVGKKGRRILEQDVLSDIKQGVIPDPSFDPYGQTTPTPPELQEPEPAKQPEFTPLQENMEIREGDWVMVEGQPFRVEWAVDRNRFQLSGPSQAVRDVSRDEIEAVRTIGTRTLDDVIPFNESGFTQRPEETPTVIVPKSETDLPQETGQFTAPQEPERVTDVPQPEESSTALPQDGWPRNLKVKDLREQVEYYGRFNTEHARTAIETLNKELRRRGMKPVQPTVPQTAPETPTPATDQTAALPTDEQGRTLYRSNDRSGRNYGTDYGTALRAVIGTDLLNHSDSGKRLVKGLPATEKDRQALADQLRQDYARFTEFTFGQARSFDEDIKAKGTFADADPLMKRKLERLGFQPATSNVKVTDITGTPETPAVEPEAAPEATPPQTEVRQPPKPQQPLVPRQQQTPPPVPQTKQQTPPPLPEKDAKAKWPRNLTPEKIRNQIDYYQQHDIPDAAKYIGTLNRELKRRGLKPVPPVERASETPLPSSDETVAAPGVDFADRVNEAARTATTGKFGPNKVFINHVWNQLKDDPQFKGMDLEGFKKRLVEENRKGTLALSRADLIEAMDPKDVAESDTKAGPALFNFVQIQEQKSAPKETPQPPKSKPKVTREHIASVFPGTRIVPVGEGYRVEFPAGGHLNIEFAEKIPLKFDSVEKELGRKLSESEKKRLTGYGVYKVRADDGTQLDGFGLVRLASRLATDETVRHEAVHFAHRAGFFSKEEWDALVKQHSDPSRPTIQQEGDIARAIQSKKGKKAGVVEQLKSWFSKLLNAAGLKPLDAETVEAIMRSPDFWARTPSKKPMPQEAFSTGEAESREPWQMTLREYKSVAEPETVRAVASRTSSGRVLTGGIIHPDLLRQLNPGETITDEGFITSDGRYVSRSEAAMLTGGDYWWSVAEGYQEGSSEGVLSTPEKKRRKQVGEYHKYEVARAIKAGKPVPPEVLADYPGLQSEDVYVEGQARPDLANPVSEPEGRPLVDEVDEARNQLGLPERRADEAVFAEAQRRIEANYEKEREALLTRADSGGMLSDIETVIAKKILTREASKAVKSKNPDDVFRAATLINAYRETGTEQGRAFRQRRDPLETPAQRNVRIISEAILEPSKDVMEAVKAAKKRRDLSAEDKAKQKHFDLVQKTLDGLKALGIEKPEDVANDAVKASQAINAIAALRANKWDAAYEYWRNAILSSPTTHVRNIVGTTANAAWTMTAERMTEAMINTLARRPEGAQLGEFKYMLAGMLPGISRGSRNFLRSWASEAPFFEREVGGAENVKIEDSNVAIKGKKGRAIRIPQRMLLAVDEFMKSTIATMEAGAHAYRIAKAEGHSGEALQTRIENLVNDLESDAWHSAVESARRLAFQERHGKAISLGLSLRKEVPGLRYLIPFVTTPMNIFKTGFRKSPIGSVQLGMKLYKAAKTGDYTGITAPMAEQVLAWAIVAALMGNDEDDPWITGASDSVTPEGRDMSYRTFPAQSVRIGEKWYSYAGVEPFATAVGMTVDWINALKSGDPEKQTSAPIQSLVAQVRSKTFLSGLSDFIEATDPENLPKTLPRWASSFAVSWVPNAVRATGRAAKDEIPERGVWGDGLGWYKQLGKRTIQRTELPILEDVPKVDLWGRTVSKPTSSPASDMVWRLLSPAQESAPDVFIGDRVLVNWNNAHPEDERYPMLPQKHYVAPSGKRAYMDEKQYHQFLKTSGSIARELVSLYKLNADEPTERDLEVVTSSLTDAREFTRKALVQSWHKGKDAPEDYAAVAKELHQKRIGNTLYAYTNPDSARRNGESDEDFAARQAERNKDQREALMLIESADLSLDDAIEMLSKQYQERHKTAKLKHYQQTERGRRLTEFGKRVAQLRRLLNPVAASGGR